jgi:hypothetical protein
VIHSHGGGLEGTRAPSREKHRVFQRRRVNRKGQLFRPRTQPAEAAVTTLISVELSGEGKVRTGS